MRISPSRSGASDRFCSHFDFGSRREHTSLLKREIYEGLLSSYFNAKIRNLSKWVVYLVFELCLKFGLNITLKNKLDKICRSPFKVSIRMHFVSRTHYAGQLSKH